MSGTPEPAPGTPTLFGDDVRARAAELVARYPRPRSALLPLLYLVQSVQSHVSPDGIAFCAEQLGLTAAEVTGVATFYTMFKREPVGGHLVAVCTNISCKLRGADAVYAALEQHLGVGHEQTTDDGAITLEHVECAAACDYAPVMTVDYEFFDQVTPESAVAVVDALRAGAKPMPTRGAPLSSFKEINLLQAGFADTREGAVAAGGSAGENSLRGLVAAAERGEAAPAYPVGQGG